MIDIHAHILPGLDDGSEDLIDSVLMAELAAEGGTDIMIATPHGNNAEKIREGFTPESYLAAIRERLAALREELKKRSISLRVYPGMEILCTPDVAEHFRKGELLPMAGSGLYLIEFEFDASARYCSERIRDLLEEGAKLIIAHPERYDCVKKDPFLTDRWREQGCRLQVNRGSIEGKFGRGAYRAAWDLLEANRIDYLASDAHSPYHRTPFMGEAERILSREFSPKRADALLETNARRDIFADT